MGQKVHPFGFRLGITKFWDSRWIFPDKKVYRAALINDIAIREGIMKKFAFAIVTRVEIERAINKVVVTIHAVKPGMIIGRGGKGLEDVKKFITGTLGKNYVDEQKLKIELHVEHVKKPYLSAYYVAQDIGNKLIRNLPHRLVVHQALDRVREAGGKGVKIQLGGRIRGATISRTEKYFEGTIPSSTIREDIDFASFPARTRSGYVGVKVWIAK